MHRHDSDKGVPYGFESAFQLLEDFFKDVGNLSRTLKTMSHYGIVEMRREKKRVRPIARATEFQIVAA